MRLPLPQRVPAGSVSRVATGIVGVGALVLGVAITVSDDDRFQSAGYATIRSVPGAMDIWGDALMVAGLLVLVGSGLRRYWLKVAGIVGFWAWCFAFGLGAIDATVRIPTAGPTGGPVYLMLGWLALCLALYDERMAHR